MIIYKATNLINGKIYIGQTVKSLKKRSFEHKSDSKRDCYAFPRAIKKYGFENFKWEVLEECFSQQDLDEKECKWIKDLDSNNRDVGYNIAMGGNPGKEIGQRNLSKLWKTKEFREKMKQATRKGARKLSDIQISEIKASYKAGFGIKTLSKYYEVSTSGIESIVYNKSWKEIEPLEKLNDDLINQLNEIKNQLRSIRIKNCKESGRGRKALTDLQISKIKFLKNKKVPAKFCQKWFCVSFSLVNKIYCGEKFPEIPGCLESDFNPGELDDIWAALKIYKHESHERKAAHWFKPKNNT